MDQLEGVSARVDQLEVAAGRMPELQATSARVAEIEAAATALEPRVRALEDAPAASLDAVHPMLSAQGFRLVDAAGEERAVLRMEGNGPSLRFMPPVAPGPATGLALGWNRDGPSLRMFDDRGNPLLLVGVTDDGPELTIRAPGPDANDAGASLRITENGLPHLGMVDRAGRPRAALGLASTNADGGVRVRLSEWAEGPSLRLNHAQGVSGASLGVSETGSVLGLHDESGNLRTAAAVTAQLAAFELYDAEGTVRAQLSDTADATRLVLQTAPDTLGALLAVTDGARLLGIFDESGTPRIFAGFDPTTGAPIFATFDADLNLIWQSDEPPNAESESETTASAGG